jgi:polo-like kinase 1
MFALQINFFDQTAIVLSNTNHITYVNKDGTRSHHSLQSVVGDSRPDILKRLKYTKDILSQLITGTSTR